MGDSSHGQEQGVDKGEDGSVRDDCFEAQLLVLSNTVFVLDGGGERMEGVRFGVDGQNSVFFLLLSHMFLLMLVIQTVMYFVCKSYHREIVDKSALSYHLEVYECYEPLKTKDVQLDYHV